MKEGRLSTAAPRSHARAHGSIGGVERRSSFYRLPLWGDQANGNLAPVAQFICGPSGGQCVGGALGSEGLAADQHVPDRVREATRELDLGDPRSALAPEPALGALIALAVERVTAGPHRRLDQRPAQVS